MLSKTIIKKNEYYDSVTLMSLSSKLSDIEGVEEAVVAMSTKMNKELLAATGMFTAGVEQCGDNDLIIAIKAISGERYEQAFKLVEEFLTSTTKQKKRKEQAPTTMTSALETMPEANLAIISVPGEYAAREARTALDNGLHVMIFSDNVTIEQEKALKEYGREKNLLVMGPDCGTAVINNIGLCFANKVKKGNIGLVSASGTGLQEVMVLIDKFGGTISQAIGTGGRDLREEIGGIMMIQGLKALWQDDLTEVIVLISKPPAKSVEVAILSILQDIKKPVVVCFINGNPVETEKVGAVFADSLEAAAKKAVKLAGIKEQVASNKEELAQIIAAAKKRLNKEQRFLRGLFCGGTLCAEALYVLRKHLAGVKSNVAEKGEDKILDLTKVEGNVLLDLGDDHFTLGRPHPMIDPVVRLERIAREANDQSVGVILLDFELGFGSHQDPVGITIPAIIKAKENAAQAGRHIIFIGYICGTKQERQNYEEQKAKLKAAGVIVAASNIEAAKIAAKILS